jgi:hypothetical protein
LFKIGLETISYDALDDVWRDLLFIEDEDGLTAMAHELINRQYVVTSEFARTRIYLKETCKYYERQVTGITANKRRPHHEYSLRRNGCPQGTVHALLL